MRTILGGRICAVLATLLFAGMLVTGVLVTIATGGLVRLAHAQGSDPAAVGADLTVTTLSQAVAADGECSLREAIDNANADAAIHADCASGSGADTIHLAAEAIYVFDTVDNNSEGPNALPSITSELTIEGNDATLVRSRVGNAPPFRFFYVADGARLVLRHLDLRNGVVENMDTDPASLYGGAILNRGACEIFGGAISFSRASLGGAIYSGPVTPTLTITNTVFSYNVATISGGALHNTGSARLTNAILSRNQSLMAGGAIANESAQLAIHNSTLRDNESNGTGGALLLVAVDRASDVTIENSQLYSNTAVVAGGAIANTAVQDAAATLVVRTSSVISNIVTSTAQDEGVGGGILNQASPSARAGGAALLVERSHIRVNSAQLGGGIANIHESPSPTVTAALTVMQSTLAGNIAQGSGLLAGSGGGILSLSGDLTVVNSTLSGNRAQGDATPAGAVGGAIANLSGAMTATLRLLNSTLVSNTAAGEGGALANGALLSGTTPVAEVGNSLFVGNSAESLASMTCAGDVTSLGHNLEDTDTCSLNAAGDSPATFVVVGPLIINGGPTPTHLIQADGPAFNAGDAALCSAAPVSGVDQRGISRPQGFACDIGAVELVPGRFGQYLPVLRKGDVEPSAR